MPRAVEDKGDIGVAETLTPSKINGVGTQFESDTALQEYSTDGLNVEPRSEAGGSGETVGASCKPVDSSSDDSHLEIGVMERAAFEATTIIDATVGRNAQDASKLGEVSSSIGGQENAPKLKLRRGQTGIGHSARCSSLGERLMPRSQDEEYQEKGTRIRCAHGSLSDLPQPNGSRLGCGASAGGRKQPALRYEVAGAQTYAASESRPRQLQALVRQPAFHHGTQPKPPHSQTMFSGTDASLPEPPQEAQTRAEASRTGARPEMVGKRLPPSARAAWTIRRSWSPAAPTGSTFSGSSQAKKTSCPVGRRAMQPIQSVLRGRT